MYLRGDKKCDCDLIVFLLPRDNLYHNLYN